MAHPTYTQQYLRKSTNSDRTDLRLRRSATYTARRAREQAVIAEWMHETDEELDDVLSGGGTRYFKKSLGFSK